MIIKNNILYLVSTSMTLETKISAFSLLLFFLGTLISTVILLKFSMVVIINVLFETIYFRP